MYPLFESIKIKNDFAYHIALHQQRISNSYKAVYNKECSLEIADCLEKMLLPKTGLFKCRLRYNEHTFDAEIIPYIPREINSLKVIRSNISYQYKFTKRDQINKLFQQKGNADDIIIVKDGLITDSSYSNLVFFDGDDWFTSDTPLLKGIQREYLLSTAKIKERQIAEQDLSSYKLVGLINAMLDFEDKMVVPVSNIIF